MMVRKLLRAIRGVLRMPGELGLRIEALSERLEAQERLLEQAREKAGALQKALERAEASVIAQVDWQATRLSDQLNIALNDLTLLTRRQIDYQRETRLLLSLLTLPPADTWTVPVTAEPAPGTGVFSQSAICRQESFDSPYFPYWTAKLGYALRYHRKLWEFVFICQAMQERGLIGENVRGLGFGVGEERLAAYFASQGMKITGTDMAPDAAAESGWVETAQHANGKESLRYPDTCSEDLFDANVEFRFCDMNHIPANLKGYDFCWSACALEHLGSIELGLNFIENSLATLRPGGFAIHTTEFNLSSDSETVDNSSTVLFRAQDFERLAKHLARSGHYLSWPNLDPGSGPMDRYIDVAPYRDEPHLKLALEGYACTSIGLIVQKAWT